MKPVAVSRTSQSFADDGSYASREDKHGPSGHHTGTDYGSLWPVPIAGRLVRAVLPGEVVISSFNSTMGNWVGVYNHDRDLLVTYWHMSGRKVQVGDWVHVYQPLGRVGSTGNSSAAHLHLQVNSGQLFDYHGHIHPGTAVKVFGRRDARRRWHLAKKRARAARMKLRKD